MANGEEKEKLKPKFDPTMLIYILILPFFTIKELQYKINIKYHDYTASQDSSVGKLQNGSK